MSADKPRAIAFATLFFLAGCSQNITDKALAKGFDACLKHGGLRSITTVAYSKIYMDRFHCADDASFVINTSGEIIK